jgi:hypothetical protein
MIVWIALITYLLILKLVMGKLASDKKRKQFLLLSSIPIILIIGLRYPRYEVVYDLAGYYSFYVSSAELPLGLLLESTRFEPGYVLFNKILATIIPWPQFIFFAVAIISVSAVSYFIYKNSIDPFLSILFYVTLGTMTFQLTAFRQAIAISICLVSTEFIKKKELSKFIILVLLACTFHKIAIVFVPFYFLANRQKTPINNLLSILAFIVAILYAESITQFGNELLDMDYAGYIGNKWGGLVSITIYAVALILSWFNSKKVDDKLTFNMTLIGMIIYCMRYTTLALERISFFYTPGVIILLPNAITKLKYTQFRSILYLFAIILAISLFIYRLNSSEIGAYKFFWQ